MASCGRRQLPALGGFGTSNFEPVPPLLRIWTCQCIPCQSLAQALPRQRSTPNSLPTAIPGSKPAPKVSKLPRCLKKRMCVARCIACGSPKILERRDDVEITPEAAGSIEAPNMNIRNERLIHGQGQDEINLPAAIALVDEEIARLNALRIAIRLRSKLHSVPDEIWSTIFEIHGHLCRLNLDAANSNKGMTAHFPLILVSRKWLEITVSTPALWSFVVLHMGQSYECLAVAVAEENVDLRLRRSKQHLLDVVITASPFRCENIADYSGVLERILGESRRFNSLVLNMPVAFPVLPKIPGIFDRLTSLSIRGYRCGDSADEHFWGGLKGAPIRSLSFQNGLPTYFQFAWKNIVEMHTNRVHFLLARLKEPWSVLRTVELGGYPVNSVNSAGGDGNDDDDERVIENAKVRELRIDCNHRYSHLLVERLQLPALEELAVTECDRWRWADDFSPNLLTFLSRTHIRSLTLHNINLTGNSVQTIQLAFRDALPLLRSLHVSDFWEDGDKTPSPSSISEDRENWAEFPLYTLHHSNSVILPALESLSYAICPSRFHSGFDVDDGRRRSRKLVTEFLYKVEDLIESRLHHTHATRSKSVMMKKFVLKGGGGSESLDLDLDDFPWFVRRMDEYRRSSGLVFEFAAMG
ncbi:hypothetical protein B0H10DRAFT_2092881 [Mycena sp. CBHHK59/15]|nr:hypothetical protein B0H10DRAFT_2092881 [Mycena sp. CBHHK59/15]